MPSTPRIAPLPESEWTDEARTVIEPTKALSGGQVFNVFSTLAHHPKLLKHWMVFANHILAKSTLSARDRELLILRAGWLCGSEYEWAQHVVIGKMAGLTEEEIDRVADGPDAPGWSKEDATLLRAADELKRDSCLSDATWAALRERYSTEQILDLIFTVGQYAMLAGALNSLGVEIDATVPRPKRSPRR